MMMIIIINVYLYVNHSVVLIGRPRQRWQEDIMEDLKKMKVKNCKEIAKGRRAWTDLVERAKNQEGL